MEETTLHLEIPVIPQDEDTFAAIEVALSGGDLRKKINRKATAAKPLALPVTSTFPTREETIDAEDSAPISRRTKHCHDPAPTSGVSPRVSLRLSYSVG